MGPSDTGNFNYNGYGFNSVDEAKTKLEAVKKNVPDFLIDHIENMTVTVDVKTGKIAAHLSASFYEYDI